jgi:hypothetical protein
MLDRVRCDQRCVTFHSYGVRSSKTPPCYKHLTPTEFAVKFARTKRRISKRPLRTDCPGQKPAASPARVRQANQPEMKESRQTRTETESRHV